MSKKIYAGESGIHGRGLFAGQTIKAGELIGKVKRKRAKKDGPHVLWVSEDEGYQVDGLLKYINHSLKPNAAYYDDLTVVALKNIPKDVEITHNYGDDWEPTSF